MPTTAQTGFLVQQEIRRHIDMLVKMTEAIMTQATVNAVGDMNSQLSAFLAVTKSAPTSRVVTNWVRYQTGRKQNVSEKWKTHKLADKICSDIETRIGPIAQNAATTLSVDKDAFEMLLVQQYAGYLRRSYIANGGRE